LYQAYTRIHAITHTYILHITRFFSRVWSNVHCVLKNLKQMNYYKNIWYLTIMY